MADIRYRALEKKDYPQVKAMICDAFHIHRFTRKKQTLNSALEIYLRDCLSKSTYAQVAVEGKEPVGIIMGSSAGEPRLPSPLRHRLISIIHMITLLAGAATELKQLIQYKKVDTAYGLLKKQASLPLTAEVTLFAVKKSCRGCGIGKELFHRVRSYFHERGNTCMYLFTDSFCTFQFYEGQKMKQHGSTQVTLTDGHGETQNLDVYLYAGETQP